MTKKPENSQQASPAVPKKPKARRKITEMQSLVLQAARRRCDSFGDPQEAREQMKRDVMATPPRLLGDLLSALATPHHCAARRPPASPGQPIPALPPIPPLPPGTNGHAFRFQPPQPQPQPQPQQKP